MSHYPQGSGPPVTSRTNGAACDGGVKVMETNSMVNAEKNKNVVRRFFKAFGAADVNALDLLLAADFVPHGCRQATAAMETA